MTIEEIVHGESNNIEFKVKLPEDTAKYIKTIIAFANTQGGRLVIGVDDESREVFASQVLPDWQAPKRSKNWKWKALEFRGMS